MTETAPEEERRPLYDRWRAQAVEDLTTELHHRLPSPDRAGLAEALRDVAAIQTEGVLVQQRDAFIRLAAWAMAAAAERDEARHRRRTEGTTASPSPLRRGLPD